MNRHRPTMSTRATGATLTEVLMSMMILSIGVLSVASLFPVGILSSARATQLTHAALLRQNAEAVLALNSNLIHDPDGDGNYREHNGTVYAVDLLGWSRIGPQDTPQTRSDYFQTLQANPQTSSGVACFWGNQPMPASQSFRFGIRRFHGFEESDKDRLCPYTNFAHTSNPQQRQIRPDSVIGDEAQSVVGSRDDWLELFRTTPTFNQLAPNQFQLVIDPSVDLKSVKQQWHAEDLNGNDQLDAGEDINGNGVIDGVPIRISLIDPEGRHSQVRIVPFTAAITPNVSGGGTIGPLVFDTAAVNRITEIIVEVQNARFSWMMTVRKPSFSHGGLPANHPGAAAPASVDLVVFFQRPFGRSNETFYQVESTVGADLQPGVAQFDDNGNGVIDDVNEFFWADSDDRFSLKVIWNNSNSSKIKKPPIASGRFVFDLKHGQWYRVRNVIREYDIPNTVNRAIEFTVDRPLPDPLILTAGGMMFPKGIIAVFPLGTK
ncbi:MAG: hypothetical protein VYA32_13630 [Planctomycetota bacterium]|nr:hypothetical protein [Planctomycetota bacterium]